MKRLFFNLLKIAASIGVLLVLVIVVTFSYRIYNIINPPINRVLFWVKNHDVQSKLKARISNGLDVNQVNDYGRTLIHLAAQYGPPESLQLLIDAGADVKARNNLGQSALHFAVNGGSAESIRILLQNGAAVNVSDNFQVSPLHRAVSLGSSGFTNGESVTLLLSSGADVNARTQQDETPVHWAATSYYVEYTLVPLLNAGGNPNSINDQGESPLHAASKTGSELAVTLLLEHGADASIRDKEGNTALDKALKLPEPFTANIMERLGSSKRK